MLGASALTLFLVAAPLSATIYLIPFPLSMVLALVQCGALLLVPVNPLAAGATFLAGTMGMLLFPPPPGAPWPWSVTGMIAFSLLVAAITLRRGWRPGLWTLLVIAAVISVWSVAAGTVGSYANLSVALPVALAAYLLALLLADRLRFSAALRQERELTAAEQERRVLAEERQRIARDLHDVVAHGMSIIQVQATTARYRLDALPAEAAAEFDEIGAAARSSLAEMRRLLGALRGDDEAERVPQRGMADIPDLVAAAQRAGAEVRFTGNIDGKAFPTAVDIAGFRIAQEALSNALRHAPGSAIDLDVTAGAGRVTIAVRNELTGATAHADAAGHGIIGMRERAALAGGTIEIGPAGEGGFRVVATLPTGEEGEG